MNLRNPSTHGGSVARARRAAAHQTELERHVASARSSCTIWRIMTRLLNCPTPPAASRLSAALARAAANEQRVALLFVDLDNFK